jgi:cytochrome c peroxidase
MLQIGCKQEKTTLIIRTVDWAPVQDYYTKNLNNAIAQLDQMALAGLDNPKVKAIFLEVRKSFKVAEPYASYLNPEVGHRVNGPALPVFREDNSRVLYPIGLQKIGESIYAGEVSNAEFQREIRITRGMMENLRQNIEKRPLNAQRFFVASHQQLLRILSLGISGFDTPSSLQGLSESAVSLQSLWDAYDLTFRSIIQDMNRNLDQDFEKCIQGAISYLEEHQDFNAFDRYVFIREYLNPVTRNWVKLRKESGLWDGAEGYPFNFDAETFFDEDAFNTTFFTPPVNRNQTDAQILLGKKLFFERKLSSDGSMACVTCHIPEKAYTDGLELNMDNAGNPLERNTPTLINSIYQQSLFWDGRSGNLIDQINSVFANEKEFNSSVHQFSDAILKDSTYIDLFEKAYGEIPKKNTEIVKALSAYIGTLNGMNSKFDRNIRGEIDTFTAEEKQGFNLYMGKALCATCHFIPLTNGTVPPFYKETEKEVIGVPETAANQELDDDLGFYWVFEEDIHKGMFKTPTVRNAGVTAPYMHNGIYNTLDEVMDFYNKGGGGGLGFKLEHQTLPFDQLNLTDKELQALVAFVKTLNDTEVDRY